MQKGELKLRVLDDEVKFSVINVVRHPAKSDACFMIGVVTPQKYPSIFIIFLLCV